MTCQKTDLSHQQLLSLLTYEQETGKFFWSEDGREAGCQTPMGYQVIGVDGRLFLAHRLAWFYVHGKWRPVEPGSFPLAHGASKSMGRSRADWHTPAGEEGQGHRAGRLKGYGNAINAEAARVFVECVMEVCP